MKIIKYTNNNTVITRRTNYSRQSVKYEHTLVNKMYWMSSNFKLLTTVVQNYTNTIGNLYINIKVSTWLNAFLNDQSRKHGVHSLLTELNDCHCMHINATTKYKQLKWINITTREGYRSQESALVTEKLWGN
jgi:hypothetical protein